MPVISPLAPVERQLVPRWSTVAAVEANRDHLEDNGSQVPEEKEYLNGIQRAPVRGKLRPDAG